MQQGIDLQVTTYTALGEKADKFNSSNFRNGYKLFPLLSNKKDHAGKYELLVQNIKRLIKKG